MPSGYKTLATRKRAIAETLKKRHQLPIILDRMSSGRLLTEVCQDEDIDWNENHIRALAVRDGQFGHAYRRAREHQLHQWADQIVLDLKNAPADRDEILRARYIADNRKWVLSRLLPSVYSDKHDITEQSHQPKVTVHINMHDPPNNTAASTGGNASTVIELEEPRMKKIE